MSGYQARSGAPGANLRATDEESQAASSPSSAEGGKPGMTHASEADDAGTLGETSAKDVLDWLVPDLKVTLASLDGAPKSVALAVVQLLPFGSRASLISLGLVRRQDTDEPCAVVEFTPLAYEVMAAAALEADSDPVGVADWLQRARDAAKS